jgi:hypothetical protein
LEPGEERPAGLARELREELGIAIEHPRPLMRVRHAYHTREILLDMWVVKHYRGEPQSLDGQALRWCPEEDLPAAQLLPADEPIVRALRLPERLTVAVTADYRVTADVVRSLDRKLSGTLCATSSEARIAAASDVDFLVMRSVLDPAELADLCSAVPLPVFALGVDLWDAWASGASGVSALASGIGA